MAAYVPPDWGVDGANAFGIYVEVIKSGVVVENMKLPTESRKSCVVAGRMEPLCDLVLQHPSISRVHAVLQFDKQGALFLRDLESTHGTFLNKKRIPANEFVRLHIGDVVVFGESTRLYAVCGPLELLPQEYDSLNLQKFREKSEQRQEKKAIQRKSSGRSGGREDDDDSGASWGFGEDAAEEDDDDEEEDEDHEEGRKDKDNLPEYLRNLKEDDTPYKSSLKQNEINEKDQKLFQQLQTRIKKMENLKLEKSRIQAKQNQLTGLTEGQEKTLERNEQHIQALKKEIEDIEERIHAKNAQREKTKSGAASTAGVTLKKKKSVNESLYGYESDEDDFYDRTKSNQRKLLERKQQLGVATGELTATTTSTISGGAKKNQSEVLTAESIQAKIKTLERSLSELATEYEEEQLRASRDVVVQEQKQEEELDPLDSFMATTTRELHSTQLSSIEMRKQELDAELRRQRQLLVVATPALAHVPALARAESKPESVSAERKPVIELPSPSQPQKQHECENESVLASQPEHPEVVSTSPVVSSKRPAESREREQTERTDATEERKESSISKSRKKSSSSMMTSDAEAAPAKVDSVQPKKRRVVGPALGPTRPPASSTSSKRKDDDMTGFGNEASTLEGGDRVWVPPTNQTGDGRTKLNDKYGY